MMNLGVFTTQKSVFALDTSTSSEGTKIPVSIFDRKINGGHIVSFRGDAALAFQNLPLTLNLSDIKIT